MAFSGTIGVEGITGVISSRVTAVNMASCLVSSALLAVFYMEHAPGFAAGFLIGAMNIYWLLRIARKGILMNPEKAGRLIAISYHVRFAAVALAFGLLITKGLLSPWPMLAGLTVSVFTTICTMIFLAREEASHA